MSLYKYASDARAFAEEMLEEMRNDRFEPVLPECEETALHRFYEYHVLLEKQALLLLSKTPAQRQSLLSKHELEDEFWLLAIATYYALRAAKLLDAVDDHLHPGGPYRQKRQIAAEIVADVSRFSFDWWPFVE